MEIPSCVQAGHLCPRVASHVIDLALVHAFARQGAPDGVNLTPAPTCQYARERVRPPLKDHVTPLLQPLVDELIARLCGLAGLSSSRQEDPSFFVLHTHEVRRNLDVDDVGPVGMAGEVVHEQVVCVIHKEVKSVNHFSVVSNQWHLDGLFNHFCYRLLCLLLLLE